MLQGLRTVCYKVSDLDKAKKWYSEIFGIEPYFDQPFYVGYNVGGYELGLDPDINGLQTGNNAVVYWGVKDLHSLMQLLKEKNITISEDIKDVGDNILVASISDPFGNIIGLIENPHFKLSTL